MATCRGAVVGCVECPERRSASVQERAHKRERLLRHLLLRDMPTILENLEAPIRQVVGQFLSQRRRHHWVLSAPYHECRLLDRPIARNRWNPAARNEPLQTGWYDLLRHFYERSLSSRFVQGDARKSGRRRR